MRVFNGKAWTFESQFLILKQWEANVDTQEGSFNKVHLWVPVWNLPIQWISKETGSKFRNLFSDVRDVLIPESGSKKGRCLKVLAEIRLDKPLLRGTKIRYEEQKVWVDFKYENMADFYFYCGRVGHVEKSCMDRNRDGKEGRIQEDQFGGWLRAERK